jgi:hypothetical protein
MRVRVAGSLLLLVAACKFPELPPVDETGDGGGPDADLAVPQPLTVTITGEGSVSSDPPGIDCGSTCMADFDPLSTVTLTATPQASSTFDGWSGDCSGMGPCSLTMDGAKTANARLG